MTVDTAAAKILSALPGRAYEISLLPEEALLDLASADAKPAEIWQTLRVILGAPGKASVALPRYNRLLLAWARDDAADDKGAP